MALMKEKPVLRYGWQRTKECQDFGKAYICVRKCLDLNYDAAYSNTTCHCTCYRVHDLAKYKIPTGPPRSEWKKGYPSTKKPYWIQGYRNPDTPAPTDATSDDGSGDDGSGDDGSGDHTKHHGGGTDATGGTKGGGGDATTHGGGAVTT